MIRESTTERRQELAADVMRLVEADYADPDFTLDDVAHHVASSRRQLQRVLPEILGMDFRTYLRRHRMRCASELLTTTPMAVGDIARRVGYRQSAQFSKAFRREHGQNPQEFRDARRHRRFVRDGHAPPVRIGDGWVRLAA